MAGQIETEEGVIFYDRLCRCYRSKSNGSIELVGGGESGIKIRIHQSSPEDDPIKRWISLHLCSQLLVNGIPLKIVSVSEDGYEVCLILWNSVRKFTRKYYFKFFDEAAAKNFFDRLDIVRNTSHHLSFEDMQDESRQKEEEEWRAANANKSGSDIEPCQSEFELQGAALKTEKEKTEETDEVDEANEANEANDADEAADENTDPIVADLWADTQDIFAETGYIVGEWRKR